MKVKYVDYHRNGVGGTGFHVVMFTEEGRNMLGVVFPEQGSCAVFDADLIGNGDVRFLHNSWRGDHYEDELRAAITAESAKDYKQQDAERKARDTEFAQRGPQA